MSFYRTSSFEGNFAEEIYDLVSSFSLLPILCLAVDELMWVYTYFVHPNVLSRPLQSARIYYSC